MGVHEEAGAQLAAVLAAVDAGELRCTPLMRRRMEGARVALAEVAERVGNGRLPDGPEDVSASGDELR